MLMPKEPIYFSETSSDEANSHANSIKCPIGKKANNSGYFPVSVIQEAPRDSGLGPNVLLCFDGLDSRFDDNVKHPGAAHLTHVTTDRPSPRAERAQTIGLSKTTNKTAF
jgi:hypothetical protein